MQQILVGRKVKGHELNISKEDVSLRSAGQQGACRCFSFTTDSHADRDENVFLILGGGEDTTGVSQLPQMFGSLVLFCSSGLKSSVVRRSADPLKSVLSWGSFILWKQH